MGEILSEITLNENIRCLKNAGRLSTKDIEDRHYKIGELYELRLMFFKILSATWGGWKTKKHHNGSMFNDSFLTGITTPLGEATFHFKIDYYDEFEIPELERGPEYNGYEWPDVRDRLNSLRSIKSSYIDTGKSVIFNPDNKIYIDWFKVIDDIEKVEDMKRHAKEINDIIKSWRDEGFDTNNISDGNHPFSVLYDQRRTLLRLILDRYEDLAWMSNFDVNGVPIGEEGKFLVGLDTPSGPVGFIFNGNRYNDFNVRTISRAPIANEDVRTDVLEKLASVKIRKIIM